MCPPLLVHLLGSAWFRTANEAGDTQQKRQPVILVCATQDENYLCKPDKFNAKGKLIAEEAGDLEPEKLDKYAASEKTAVWARGHFRNLYFPDSRIERIKSIAIHIQVKDEITEQMFGPFTSAPVSVISKPSQKRSFINSEMSLHHGDEVCLFSRSKGQAGTTKFLFTQTHEEASAHLNNSSERIPSDECVLSSSTVTWEPFRIYMCEYLDCSFSKDNSPALLYDREVILESCFTNVRSQRLTLRKVQTRLMVQGQTPGNSRDPVNSLAKIAFELPDSSRGAEAAMAKWSSADEKKSPNTFEGDPNETLLELQDTMSQYLSCVPDGVRALPAQSPRRQSELDELQDNRGDLQSMTYAHDDPALMMLSGYPSNTGRIGTCEEHRSWPNAEPSGTESTHTMVWEQNIQIASLWNIVATGYTDTTFYGPEPQIPRASSFPIITGLKRVDQNIEIRGSNLKEASVWINDHLCSFIDPLYFQFEEDEPTESLVSVYIPPDVYGELLLAKHGYIFRTGSYLSP